MTTAIVRRDLTPGLWDMIRQAAPVFKDSRLFGVVNEQQAVAIMCKGVELGLSLTASFELIHVIDGKPSLSPRGALALILNSSDFAGMEIKEEDEKGTPKSCAVTLKRKNGLVYTGRFSMEDAKRAGLVKTGSGWDKYPALMLKWRACGFAADIVFPDIIGGMKRSDELGADLTPNGDAIPGSWTVVEQKSQPKPVDEISALLMELVSEYGAEKVMAENGGLPPTTREEILAVTAKLNKQNGKSPEFTMADVPEMAPA